MITLLLLSFLVLTSSFEFPKIPTLFKAIPEPTLLKTSNAQLKEDLIQSISSTSNGKNASAETQSKVLKIVRELETKYPISDELLSNPSFAKKLDGVWYLQYTSPSVIDDKDDFLDAWKPVAASEGINIPTNQIQSRGSVSASGITVDTSNRVVKQIFDIDNNMVSNVIQLNDSTTLKVGGTFRVSENVPTRAVASFKDVDFMFKNGFVLKLGFLFDILALVKGTSENGWLETTYLDDDIRIGRGNKGSMFVLTRDFDAVTP